MSIFSEATIEEMNDSTIEKYYILEWDFMRGKKIKKRLYPRKREDDFYVSPDHKHMYYNPDWIFYTYLSNALEISKFNARHPKKNKGVVKDQLCSVNSMNRTFCFNLIK